VKPVLNTLLFTVLIPAAVGGWIPLSLRGGTPPTANLALRCLAVVCIASGIAVYLHTAFWGFALRGHGSPAPIAPPKTLVVVGLHRYVGNPMYLGVLLVVVGEALLFKSKAILLYAAGVWFIVHWFVLFYEDRHWRRPLANEYKQRVPRWIPRFTSHNPGH
jgi:protein-S-isoprenylcysteine O-methyltransferase Ste14